MAKDELDPAVARTGTPEDTGLPDFIDKGAAAATAAFTLIATIAGSVTALGGGGTRILVNHPDMGVISIGLIAVGIAVALVGAFVLFPGRSHRQQRRRVFSLAIASLCIVSGFLVGLRATSLTASRSDQPTISASLQGDTTLTLQGNASTDAMAENERLFVEIRAYFVDPFSKAAAGKNLSAISDLLFSTQAGPSATGTVQVPFAVGIRPGLYEMIQVAAWTPGAPEECRNKPAGETIVACLSIRMPATASRPPELDVSFQGTGNDRVAIVHLTARTTDNSAMVLSVVGKTAKGESSTRSQVLVTTSNGVIDRTVRVAIGDSFHDLCAFVRAPTAPPLATASCPLATNDATVWEWAAPGVN